MTRPDKILISISDIERICDEYIKKNVLDKWFTFFLGIILPLWFSVFTLLNSGWTIFNTAYVIISALLTIITFFLGAKKVINRKKVSIVQKIKKQAEEESECTALFIIAQVLENKGKKTIQVLVQKKETWNCDFLPYCDIDKDKSLDEQKENFCSCLAGKINIGRQHIDIFHLQGMGCYSIKVAIPEHTEKMFRHEFYIVKFDGDLKDELPKSYSWRDVDSLAEDVNTIRINGDVVDSLVRIKSRIIDSFDLYTVSKDPIKIIWNITNKCSFDCKICATASKRTELSEMEKAKVLLSILTVKDSIKELNFAGGDPLASDDAIKTIQYASTVIDRNKISVTTTGSGVQRAISSGKRLAGYNIILSLDMENSLQGCLRNEDTYNSGNVYVSKKYRLDIPKLRINIPIISVGSETEQNEIIDRINDIKPDEVTLIRLMPVGRQTKENYPDNYNPEQFIKNIKEKINSEIKLHVHCALRCLNTFEVNPCTMLDRKIGIDCSGNVFACCWAGYLNCEIEQNPFYLGNLLEQDLKEILEGNKAFSLSEKYKNCRNKCSIFQYVDEKTI